MSEQLQPPNSFEAEQALLGAILRDNSHYLEVATIIDWQDFYQPKHQKIYKSIESLISAGSVADITTVYRPEDLGATYLVELAELGISSSAVVDYANIIRTKAVARRAISLCNEAVRGFYTQDQPADEVIGSTIGGLTDCLCRGTEGAHIRLVEAVRDVVANIDHFSDSQKRGILTGFKKIDELTSGFHKRKLHLLAGRPGLGKTALSVNMAINQIEAGRRVAYFSAETDRFNFALRALCSTAKVNSMAYKMGRLSPSDIQSMTADMSRMSDWPFFLIDTHRIDINSLRARAGYLKAKENIDIVYIDYGQLITTKEKFRSRYDQLNHIIFALTDMASDLDLPVVCVCQLNRELEKGRERSPRLSDLRESGNWENEARLIIALWQPPVPKKQSPVVESKMAEALILKQNDGPTGKVELIFEKQYFKFIDPNLNQEDMPF